MGLTAGFTYDAFGRRVSKTVNGVQARYLYDGADSVQEQSSGGTPSANMLVGGVDEVFTRADAQGTSSVLHDGLGSALALTDAAGAVTGEYSYEPFGQTSQTGASANASQYTGGENDQTGLYYYRSRYYSPRLQRFISEDGLDFLAGDTNLYAYVGNDPCNNSDPSGNVVLATCVGGAIFDMAVYTAAAGLPGQKLSEFDWGDFITSGGIGCASGVGGYGLVKAAGKIWRGLKAARAARSAGIIDDVAKTEVTIFRQGTFPDEAVNWEGNYIKGKQWATDHPLTSPNYAQRYGLPTQNTGKPDWVVGGRVQGPYTTRPAPPSHNNPLNTGGATEVIPVNPNSVRLNWFHMPD